MHNVAKFKPYILYGCSTEHCKVRIQKMTKADAEQTNQRPLWQTDWTSDFISNPDYLKYSVKTMDGELVALGAYEILPAAIVVHIAYIESHPESNPTIAGHDRKYQGIGRVLLAFGIKLSIDNDFGGDITFEAKTAELAEHYERDHGAMPLPSFDDASAPRFLLSGEAAKRIFLSYLE